MSLQYDIESTFATMFTEAVSKLLACLQRISYVPTSLNTVILFPREHTRYVSALLFQQYDRIVDSEVEIFLWETGRLNQV